MVSNFVWGVLLVLLFSTVCSRSALVRPREVDVRAGEPRNTVQAFQRYIRVVYQPQAEDVIYNDQEASWAYNINITGYNEELMIAASEETALFDQETAQYVRSSFSNIDFSSNMTLKRLYDKLVLLGDANLNSTDFSELQAVQTRMQRIYNTAKICRNPSIHADDVLSKCPKDQQLNLEPDVSQILATSRNETLLRHVWKSWRDATGKKMHGDYQRYVELKNKASSMDGYADTGAAWRSTYVDTYTNYTDQMFLDEAEAIWQQLKPLYEQLHAYIRHKLKEQYPTVKALSNTNSPIPAHLLGNMWAQTWGNLQEFTRPHPEKQSLDVTEAMVEQNYTADTMFRKSDDFFATLGLIRMPQKFWDKSMIERPADNSTKVVCHASAWDFYNRQDFRIKQCTEVTMEDFLTVHHEMGHVEYYLQYKDLEVPFRRGANDGFHEAVGDTLALSVQTPAHLKSLGLLMADFDINDPDLERNSLYSTALEKIAFLPFGYLMDKYRYDIFSGKIKPEQYNSKWWEHLVEYQGICSPVKRSDSDFDPGSKYHIPAGVPYMRYFVSFILQFQFHKAMCQEAGYTGPLHRCDVSAPELEDGGKRAGALLAKTLKMGSSQPWTQAISAITNGNSSRMDAGPLLEFFAPMQQWLTQKNAELGITPGWSKEPECSEETAFQAWLNLHNNESSVVKSAEMFATWAYQTNITKANELAMLEASNVAAAFAKRKTEEMLGLFPNPDEITDPLLRRAYEKLSKLGDAALSPEDFARLGAIRTEMEQVYSVAKVCNDTSIGIDMERCPQHQQMALSPEITDILHSSRDPEELLYYWSAWRDATGKKMRNNFTEYVGLKNKAAVADGYKDNAEAWRAPYVEPSYNYTDADFLEDADRLWNQMKPLYQQLHAYIRYKLWELYGNKTVPSLNGPIPAHLLSNQWAQTWVGLLDFTEPFPGKPQLDVTQEMQKQGWTARRMFNVSEEFFTDLGLIGMPEEFWKISVIEKPSDREVVCHASAEDFYDGIHFGIKQCTAVTMSDLLTVHHEMGHVEYFIQYKEQYIAFRDGANDGFHEAVGDVLSLSVSTPGHLEKLDLLTGYNATDEDAAINFMYSTALKKIAFLPFGLVMDMYRYDVFNGKISMQELNRKWWEYVVKYQGICHAVPRDESDFDPGAKFHTAADVPYMRYFVSFVIQFQFHEALCGVANHSGPLHTCDIDGSKEAGAILSQALSLGSSKPWQEAMRIITGQDQMDAQPLLSYFKPLQDWLQAENRRLKQTVGWVEDASCIEEVTTMPTIPTVSTLSTVPSVSSSQTTFVSPITEPVAGGSTITDSSASRTTTPPSAATSPSAEVASTSTTNEPVENTTASAGSLSLPLLLHALALYALLFCVRF